MAKVHAVDFLGLSVHVCFVILSLMQKVPPAAVCPALPADKKTKLENIPNKAGPPSASSTVKFVFVLYLFFWLIRHYFLKIQTIRNCSKQFLSDNDKML